MHLVKWDKVCKSKEGGGLGLKKAKDQNLAFLTKLAWKVSNDEEAGLWVSILRDKYLSNQSISSWPRRRPASHLWKSILDTKQVIDKGVKWIIGDGKTVKIWHDWWCGDKPLALSHPGIHTNSSQKVECLIMDGHWALGEIAQFLDTNTMEAINSIPLPIYTQGPDHPSWVGYGNGKFSISAAYELINKSESDQKGWKWFWKLKIPEKLKTFTWLILHNSLPTNHLRVRRAIDTSELCPRCSTCSENISHLFRECVKAKELWSNIPSSHLMRGNLETPIHEWISLNLRCNKILENGYDILWHILFITSLWQIWKDRNKMSFDNIEIPSCISARNIMAYS